MSYNHIYSHKKRPTFLLKSVDSPAHATGRDKTKDKTLNAFKAKRKAKDEKQRTCVNSPKQRSSSPMDMEISDSDSEDGQFSKVDQEDERLFGKLKSAATEPAMDISDVLARKRQLAGQGTATERSRLIAQRRHDYDEAGATDAQLATLPKARPRRKRPRTASRA
ncbi:hypothetical protein FB451DRAFT_1177218 [Mycena latifolia]|nr:hypothetical protein FB451DRAFT_1177218 [Mycena latifolia]